MHPSTVRMLDMLGNVWFGGAESYGYGIQTQSHNRASVVLVQERFLKPYQG